MKISIQSVRSIIKESFQPIDINALERTLKEGNFSWFEDFEDVEAALKVLTETVMTEDVLPALLQKNLEISVRRVSVSLPSGDISIRANLGISVPTDVNEAEGLRSTLNDSLLQGFHSRGFNLDLEMTSPHRNFFTFLPYLSPSNPNKRFVILIKMRRELTERHLHLLDKWIGQRLSDHLNDPFDWRPNETLSEDDL